MATIPLTVYIDKKHLEDIKILIAHNKISSLSEGVNLALESYIKKENKKIYSEEMKMAKTDEDYINRTLKCQKDFEYVDQEMDNMLMKEEK